MKLDSIIKEWFYRLPKGYAQAPYSKEELKVLKQIIYEHTNNYTITELVFSRFSNLPPSHLDDQLLKKEIQQILNEAITVQDLVTIIQSTPLPQNFIAKLARIVDGFDKKAGVVASLREKGFKEGQAKLIFDKAVELDNYKMLHNLLADPATAIPFSALGVEGDLDALIQSKGFTSEFIDWLFLYTPVEKGKGTGAGENLLRITLQGGHIPAKGDVGVGDIEIEVKGEGFRLKGQKGLGSAPASAIMLYDVIYNAYESLGQFPEDFPDRNDSFSTFTKRSDMWFDIAFSDLLSKGVLSRTDIVDAYVTAFKNIYVDYDEAQLRSKVIEPSITSQGKFDVSIGGPRIAAMEFMYYMQIEDFDYFMVINKSKKYFIIPKNITFDQVNDILQKRFQIKHPSWRKDAGGRGAMSQLSLK